MRPHINFYVKFQLSKELKDLTKDMEKDKEPPIRETTLRFLEHPSLAVAEEVIQGTMRRMYTKLQRLRACF